MTYVTETISITEADEGWLKIWERKILKISGPLKTEYAVWRIRGNYEIGLLVNVANSERANWLELIVISDDKRRVKSTWARRKVPDLAYSRSETRNKLPLDRDPDRSLCNRHTCVKLSWLQTMNLSCSTIVCCSRHVWSHWVQSKGLYSSSDIKPCPGPCITTVCPEFHVGFRLGRELFT